MTYLEGSSPTEQVILEIARQLVGEQGESFTMAEVAKAANISRATLYRTIGSKNQLLQKLSQHHGVEWDQTDTRTRILQATRRVCGRYGLFRPSLEQIAQEAGVGVATVYRTFGDRETLLREFIQTHSPQLPTDELALSGELEADLIQLVRVMLRFLQENRDIIRMSFGQEMEGQPQLQQFRPQEARSLHRLTRFLQTQIDAGHLRPDDAQEMASALLGMMFAATFLMPIYYQLPEPDLEETAEFVVRLFLNGAQA